MKVLQLIKTKNNNYEDFEDNKCSNLYIES